MSDSRKCPKCEEVKDENEFSGRTNSYCRPCQRVYAKAYRDAHPDRVKRAKAAYVERQVAMGGHYRRQVLGKYGLTEKSWEALFASQDSRCSICRTDTPTGHGWHVDHDHACCPEAGRSCGRCVRAILCSECNTGLGKFRDNPALLRAAASYLERVRE